MPRSRQAQITRTAISPRFAIRIFSNMSRRLNRKKRFPILDRPAVLNKAGHYDACYVGLDLVHQLHRFNDAKDLADRDAVSGLHEWRRSGRGRFVERADDRRLHIDGAVIRYER